MFTFMILFVIIETPLLKKSFVMEKDLEKAVAVFQNLRLRYFQICLNPKTKKTHCCGYCCKIL